MSARTGERGRDVGEGVRLGRRRREDGRESQRHHGLCRRRRHPPARVPAWPRLSGDGPTPTARWWHWQWQAQEQDKSARTVVRGLAESRYNTSGVATGQPPGPGSASLAAESPALTQVTSGLASCDWRKEDTMGPPAPGLGRIFIGPAAPQSSACTSPRTRPREDPPDHYYTAAHAA